MRTTANFQKTMTFINLFIYGSLLDASKREAIIGRPLPYAEPDTISGFKIDDMLTDGIPYPALVRNASSMVHGSVIVIHENEMRLLDEYETEKYGRKFVRLMSGKEAWIYAKKEEEPMNDNMEEKILYNVLRQVSRKETPTGAPDRDYIQALITIGMIKDGWDRELTDLGKSMLNTLDNKLHPWGT